MSENLVKKGLERASKGNISKFFSLKIKSFEGEYAEFSALIPETCLNPFGTVQGGMITSILDEATSLAINIYTEDKMLPNSTDIHTTFHRAIMLGLVTIKTKIIKIGRKVVCAEGQIFCKDDKIAATVIHTAILTPTNP